MDYLKVIKDDDVSGLKHTELARKIFLCTPTFAFKGNEGEKYEIFNKISLYLNIPINSIHVAGSAQTGVCAFKKKVFRPGKSDLDIAIINAELFSKYIGVVIKKTNGYSDNSKFPTIRSKSAESYFTNRVSKGIFRPDLMPFCKERANFLRFFDNLSTEHRSSFKSINACIYLSQLSFEYKQQNTILEYTRKA